MVSWNRWWTGSRAIGGRGWGLNGPDLLTVVNEGQKDAIQARRYIEWNREKAGGGWVRRR